MKYIFLLITCCTLSLEEHIQEQVCEEGVDYPITEDGYAPDSVEYKCKYKVRD